MGTCTPGWEPLTYEVLTLATQHGTISVPDFS